MVPVDEVARSRREHAVECILVCRQRDSLAALGLSNNDRVLVSTDRVLDSYPASMHGAATLPSRSAAPPRR